MDCRYGGLYANPADFNQILILGQVKSGGQLCLGVIVSKNGGATWTEVRIRNEGGSQSTSAAVDPRNSKVVYVGGRTAAYKAALYKSANGGASWTEISNGIDDSDVQCLAVDPGDSNVLYCGGNWSAWRSADGGASWSRCALPLSNSADAVVINTLNPNEVFVGNYDGVYYSQDRGLTWTDIGEGLMVPSITQLYLDPASRTLYAGTGGSGIWKRKF